MAEGISWTIRQTSRTDTTKESLQQIAITAQKTEISTRSEILFIDYKDMILYRLDRPSGQCSVFDLNETELNHVAKETIVLLSEFSVKEKAENQDINGLQCSKKIVLLGAGMFRFKTMVPKVLRQYGQSFSEAVAEYWVSRDVESWPMLQANIMQRQVAFAEIPLLKRLDPLGLIDAVNGFLVQGWQKSGGEIVESILVTTPETAVFTLHPPHECRKNSALENDMK